MIYNKETERQLVGSFGEQRVTRDCSCPHCKRRRTLVRLPRNFKCADVICDFCGYLAQVKTKKVREIDVVPKSVLGAAWRPWKERMDSGIYFPLFLVLVSPRNKYSIFYLPTDLQKPDMFRPTKPLSATAKMAGWQGFEWKLESVRGSLVRIR